MNCTIRPYISIDPIQEQVDDALYQNLNLLNIKFPMNKELKNQLKKGILRIPNSAAFYQLAYYLMSVIDRAHITPDLIYVFSDPKMSVQYRKKFLAFINDVEYKFVGFLSPIVPSWLVTAGGHKIIRLMFELTQIALLIQITKTKKDNTEFLYMDQSKADIIDQAIETHQKKLHEFIEKDCLYLKNAEAIKEIYKNEIIKIKNFTDSKLNIMSNFIESLIKKDSEFSSYYKELSNVMNTSSLLQEWENYIEQQIEMAEKNWETTTMKIKNVIKRSKVTSEEVIQIYRNKSYKDYTMEYDKSQDKFYLNNHIDELQPVVHRIVENDKLNLPCLFNVYNTILKNCITCLKFCNSNENLNTRLENHKEEMKNMEGKIDNITEIISLIHKKFMLIKKNDISDSKGHEWITEYNF